MFWQEFAKCRGLSPDFFFPVAQCGPPTKQELRDRELELEEKRRLEYLQEEVAEFCRGTHDGRVCPVLKECLEDAFVNNDKEGVRGGKTEAQRVSIKRKRVRAAHKAA